MTFQFQNLTSYRPEKDVHDIFPEEAAFKQVKLRLLFNKLKRQVIRDLHSQCPATPVLGRALTSYRPETIVLDCIWNEATLKQVELRLLFLNMDVVNAEIAGAIFLSTS